LLENAKFSTSRRHLVCATDLALAGASADAQRYFLAKVNPEHAKRNFSPASFVETHNQTCRGLGARIEGALLEALDGAVGALPAELGNRLEELYRVQALSLGFPRPNLEQAVATVDAWQLTGAALGVGAASGGAGSDQRATAAYWWLKGLALLAWPFMPRVAGRLWRQLGCSDDPRPLGLTEITPVGSDRSRWEPFGRVTVDRIEAAISRETRVAR
jgi:methionyl-tRNA synthetase